MNGAETKFFKLLSYSVGRNPLPDGFCCNEEEIKYFYELALKHDIASIVAYALEKNGLYLQDEYSLKFQDEMLFAAGRVALLDCFYNEVTAVLGQEKIDYISLKGSVIRKLYPQDYFRTSSDIDILVKKRDFERACSALKENLNVKEVAYKLNESHYGLNEIKDRIIAIVESKTELSQSITKVLVGLRTSPRKIRADE